MMNYKAVKTGEWKDVPSITKPGEFSGYVEMAFNVVETQTDQVIMTGLSQARAKQACRHLNFGGGFDGWTPQFFLSRIAV